MYKRITLVTRKIKSKRGENLMFRRVLIKKPTPDDPKKSRALFRIRCNILGKVCKVLVDLGSTNNIISEEAVENLKPTKISHVNPYKVTWINKGQSIQFNE